MHSNDSNQENLNIINRSSLDLKNERKTPFGKRDSKNNLKQDFKDFQEQQSWRETLLKGNNLSRRKTVHEQRTVRRDSYSLEQPRKSYRAQPMPKFSIPFVIYKSQKPLTIPRQFDFISEK